MMLLQCASNAGAQPGAQRTTRRAPIAIGGRPDAGLAAARTTAADQPWSLGSILNLDSLKANQTHRENGEGLLGIRVQGRRGVPSLHSEA